MLETLPIDAIQPATDAANGYANLVERGIIARQAMDTGRWVLGGNVRELVTYYGERTIEQYADDIGVEANRLYEYAELASFYPMDVREELSELDLCYTHYREAKWFKDLDQAIEFLKMIALNHWNVSQTRDYLRTLRNGGKLPPRSDRTISDLNNVPVEPRMNYQWRGRAMVSFDANGIVQLACEEVPDIDPDKPYMVIFQAIDS
jgi:hypothetical protein